MSPLLERAVEFLFKYRPFVFEKGRLVLAAPWPVYAIALAVLALAAPALFTYARARGKTRPADRAVLAALRALVLAALLLCLCRPALLVSSVVPQQSFVGVLVDDSRSMRIADTGEPRSAFVARTFGAEGSPLLKALEERFKLRFFRFSASAERIGACSELSFAGGESNLGGALDRARQDLAAVPLSGLVLVSDGADTTQAAITEPLLALKARSVPVFTVGVGRERFPKDIEVSRVSAPRSVLKGTSLVVEVQLAQRGLGGQRVQLHVEDSGRLVHTQEVRLPPEGESTTVRVHVTPSEAGPRAFRFRVASHPDEQVRENNQREVLLQVDDRREKILYFEGEPRFELKFLRRAVADDKNLQVVTLQRTSENKFLRLDVDDADELAAGFPKTREELFRYRGLILGSVEASFFTADQLRMMADFVSQRGGGLLMLGGRRSFAEGGYASTPIAEVLPVVLEPSESKERFFAEIKVELTPFGLTQGATQLAGTEEKTAERWQSLPVLSTFNPVRRTKPGAATLLVGKGEGLGGPQVVLAYQRYGRGKALAFTVQDSWQWQMHADVPLEDMTHENLWRQLLRWLVSQVPDPVTVSTPAERVAPGASVVLQAEVDDDTFLKVNNARVVAHVREPSGKGRDVPLEWTVDKNGQYRGSFTASEQGTHEIEVEATRGSESLGRGKAYVQAGELPTEYFGAEMRAPLLKRIASETGGRFYTPDTAASLSEDLRYGGGGATVVEEKDLWDMPALYLLLLALVSAEWAYRKARGLA
jgi:uncharacterized membrane protein